MRCAPLEQQRVGSPPVLPNSACTCEPEDRQLFSCGQLSISSAFPKETPQRVPKWSEGLLWCPPPPWALFPSLPAAGGRERLLPSLLFRGGGNPRLKLLWFPAVGEEPGQQWWEGWLVAAGPWSCGPPPAEPTARRPTATGKQKRSARYNHGPFTSDSHVDTALLSPA